MSNKKRSSKIRFKPSYEEDRELASLLDVGTALSAEHESNKVLEMILDKATENTNAEGGSIYLIEKIKQDSIGGAKPLYQPFLRFSHALNQGISSLNKKVLFPINTDSIAGYVAQTGKSVRIRDAYCLPENSPFQFNSKPDQTQGYRTKSVLAVPIRTNRGRILGVVQLVNKKKFFRRAEDQVNYPPEERAAEKDIIAFSEHDDKLMHAFASHAAVALENAKLTEDISNLFESFVKASVMAIEARDPSTSGHSDRVADLTVKFAEVVDHISSGSFKNICFTQDQIKEVRYASLLHDFGKIGVRENILLKGEKLFPHELETVLLRLTTIKSMNETKVWKQVVEELVELVQDKKTFDPRTPVGKGLLDIEHFDNKLEKIRKGILKANESQILDKDFDVDTLLKKIKGMSEDIGQGILTDQEVVRLSVRKGTLSPEERRQIESHVSHTYDFLSRIAWTETLQAVPDIAHAHHEKLDGTGYPRKLKADQIPVQSRMMTISDIFDALTAFDRPYKKAVEIERALDILHFEAKDGKLDTELLKIFIEAKIFEVVFPSSKRKAG